jgi:hypothetical protein
MKTFESFESNRWIWRVNLALQVVLVIALVAIVNHLAMHSYARIDLTGRRAFSLSPETLASIRSLTKDVDVIVTFRSDADDPDLAQAYRDVRGMLREFEYASKKSGRGQIRPDYVDIYSERIRAESLGAVYEDGVVFKAEGHPPRIVEAKDLYRSRNLVRSEFDGERAFNAALIDVTTARPVLYFLAGHGETSKNSYQRFGASKLDSELTARGYETRQLDLSVTRSVPDDASMIIVLAPQTPILGPELDVLRDYLDPRAGRPAGRILACLEPGRADGLRDLLLDWGILSDDVVVEEPNPAYKSATGDMLVRRFALHPITQVFADNDRTVLMGPARSVRADPGRPLGDPGRRHSDPNLEVSELFETSPESWGEFGYKSSGPRVFDPVRDLHGPIRLAALAERKIDGLGVNIQGGRLLVIGNADFLSNDRIGTSGNLTLFLNAVAWMLGRDQNLAIPARPVRRLQLTLSQEQLLFTRVSILFGPALIVSFIGVLMHLSRRR